MEQAEDLKKDRITRLRQIARYAIAGAAALLLIFILIEGYSFYRLSPERLYDEKYLPYQLSLSGDSTASRIKKAYANKKYWDVINLNANSVLSIEDIFLTGIAYLEVKNLSKAISAFQVVIADVKDSTSRLRDNAEFYLALAYLQDRDYDQAIELMNAIHNNPAHLYRNKFSRKYINQVKRLKWR